jgi:3-hydroxyisobutyrate dehydrogenase
MERNPDNTIIGFIGLGVMGKSMAGHLLAAGYKVHVFTRTRASAAETLKKGGIWQESPGGVAAAANLVITMVGYPADVKDVYFGENGILPHSQEGSVLIDMTTSSPALAVEIHRQAKVRHIAALDAPVSGGDIGAREARLSIMVGGDEEVFNEARPILGLMGQNIVYQGGPGSGQHCKMANQIVIASTMMGVCEAIRYAETAGLNPLTVLQSIEAGAAGSWSLSNLAPRMIKGDFAPGFFVKHFIKDMKIALESCEQLGLQPHGLPLAKKLYEQLAAAGGENLGTQALYKIYK